jgi:hypothetical protein
MLRHSRERKNIPNAAHSCRYNAWSSTAVDDVGIGNYTKSLHTDWTFAANAASYTTKYLTIFAQRKPS